MMRSRLILFGVAFGLWCGLSWVPDFQHMIIGIFVAALIAFLTGDLFIARPHLISHPRRYWYFIVHYLPVLAWECFKANIDVALRVINPSLPIKPGIVKVRTSLKSDTGLTFLANSITLTPGTMSVDIDRNKGVLYIHWINVKTTDTEKATQLIVERFEKILKKVFE